jgi:S-adenosylmethionine:tRNA ribosyltransferase-isomerase
VKVADFDYDLPEERIAQQPAPRRDASRLLVLERESGEVRHRTFGEVGEELSPGDLLVLNDTRVLAARLFARKPTGGGIEVLLVEPASAEPTIWRALLSGSRSLRPGMRLEAGGGLTVEILEREDDVWLVALRSAGDPVAVALARGTLPLPPYIARDEDDPRAALDRERYQTVYARVPGAVAAPTAGLHFTPELLENLRNRGIGIAWLTLHVGPGTFLPVRTDDVESHTLHEERYELPEPTVEAVERARAAGGRVVAVGTTVARTLEAAAASGTLTAGSGRTALFIYPGYRFRVVDALVTNFHLPRSTLLMLVCALAGTEATLSAYRVAVREGYRFYSYGDAMLVRGA